MQSGIVCCVLYQDLEWQRLQVCTLGGDGLYYTKIHSGQGYVYVPAALVDSYKAAANWQNYADQIRAIEDYPEITGGES